MFLLKCLRYEVRGSFVYPFSRMNDPESTIVVFFLNKPVVVRSVLYVTLSGLAGLENNDEYESENLDEAGTETFRFRDDPEAVG